MWEQSRKVRKPRRLVSPENNTDDNLILELARKCSFLHFSFTSCDHFSFSWKPSFGFPLGGSVGRKLHH